MTSSSPGDERQVITISVDAMGGDLGPSAVVDGVSKAAAASPDVLFILNGDEAKLRQLIGEHPELANRCEIRGTTEVVTMDAKPSHVMRNGKATSMWSAIEEVREGNAQAVVSCGNTGALMLVSMVRLRKLPGVNRPAIACLWPSKNPDGFNVMLDVGADVKADAADLLQYALMGGSYARNGLGKARPRIGLLNVGVEEHKGRAEIKEAHDLLEKIAPQADLEFVGFVEGGDIPSARVDVIVTDGFTGNVALKTGEGTASFIRDGLRETFQATLLSKLGAALSMGALRRLTHRIDPRRVNGGVFLGLNGTVVKSHGSADATGVASAIGLAIRLTENQLTDRIAARLALLSEAIQADAEAGSKEEQSE